jgi:polyisoprenoid-binding protein YceI
MPAEPMIEIASPPPGRYVLDLEGSTVAFTTTHLFGLHRVRGTFTASGGTAVVADPVERSTVEVVIDAASFRTPTPMRDQVVRSPMYLDTDRHPTITFTSTRWDGRVLTGDLTVREVTSPVDLTVTESSVDADSFTARATARVDRIALGVTATRGMTGRYLDFDLTARFVRE